MNPHCIKLLSIQEYNFSVSVAATLWTTPLHHKINFSGQRDNNNKNCLNPIFKLDWIRIRSEHKGLKLTLEKPQKKIV